jgi:hypothetical protein
VGRLAPLRRTPSLTAFFMLLSAPYPCHRSGEVYPTYALNELRAGSKGEGFHDVRSEPLAVKGRA